MISTRGSFGGTIKGKLRAPRFAQRVASTSPAVAVVGSWQMLDGMQSLIRIGKATFYRIPASPTLVSTVARIRPSWLLLGKGDEKLLRQVAATVRLLLPTVRLAVLGPVDDAERADIWLHRGACVYLTDTCKPERAGEILGFVEAAEIVAIDDVYQRLTAARHAELQLTLRSESSPLTRREVEVLGLLRHGLPNAAIASSLNVTESTVEFHVSNLLSKLGAANRTEAAERAKLLGL